MRNIYLTPEQPTIKRSYLKGDEVFCICDATNAPFTVTLPDVSNIENVIVNLINTSSNIVSAAPISRQFINDVQLIALDKFDVYRLIADSQNNRWIIVCSKTMIYI